MPKRYLVGKWAVYAAAAALFLLVQTAVCNYISLWGILPLLTPMVVGTVASFEDSRSAPIFALVFGVICDLGGTTPGVGFFTFLFPLAALLSARLAESLFSPGWLCSFTCVSLSYLLVAIARIALLVLGGTPGLWLMCSLALREYAVSLPFLLLVFPLCRLIHRKTNVEY